MVRPQVGKYVAMLCVSHLFATGCMTTAGFETGRVLWDGEEQTTYGLGVAGLSTPRHKPAADSDAQIPLFGVDVEYQYRRKSGLGDDLEWERFLHSPVVFPLVLGGGGGVGLRKQLAGGDDQTFAIAVGSRAAAHLVLVMAGAGVAFWQGSIDGRLTASIHGQRWALAITPKVVVEGFMVNGEGSDASGDQTSGASLLGGGSLGISYDFSSTTVAVEFGVLMGPQDHRWAEDTMLVVLPESNRHIRALLGFAVHR